MDPILNPFVPGEGTPPPELAGRDEVIKEIQISYKRALIGNPCRSFLLLGLHGTGKTVLLNEIAKLAWKDNVIVSEIEEPEDTSLASMLYPAMGKILRSCSVCPSAANIVNTGLKALKNFALGHELQVDCPEENNDPLPGIADNKDFEYDLSDMFEIIGQAAKKAKKAWILLLDEMQYLKEQDISALITALHKVAQKGLPIVFVGTGLPQTARIINTIKSYAARMFSCFSLEPLTSDETIQAVKKPLNFQNVTIDDDALLEIVKNTHGYPFFIQALAYNIWNITEKKQITLEDVRKAYTITLKDLDKDFFKIKLDNFPQREAKFIETMANLGSGPYLYSDIVNKLDGIAQNWSPARSTLIDKGIIYSPKFKYLDFTTPLFSKYINRISSNNIAH